MAYALVANTVLAPPGADGGTTPAINTTGANLIVLFCNVGVLATPGVSDSKGNTWTLIGSAQPNNARTQMAYCFNPTVGAGHTFTITNTGQAPSMAVQAWSGAPSSPLDVENTNFSNSGGTTIQPGSVTPTNDNSLIVTNFGLQVAGTASIDSGFTISDQTPFVGGNNYGTAAAYLVQTSKSAVNPEWTLSASAGARGASIAVFKGVDPRTAEIAITEGADVVAATAFANASMAVAITESADVVAATLGSTFAIAIAITESSDAIYAELGYNLNINIASEEADTVSLILDNPDSWAACTDPATAWTECSDPSTTWTNCPDPATTWTVN